MHRLRICWSTLLVLLLLVTSSVEAQEKKKKEAFLTPAEAGPDFEIQGEYSGFIGSGSDMIKIGVQVIADGDGKFRSVGYIGGLPGDGWDGTEEKKVPGHGQMEGDVCVLKADKQDDDNPGRAEIKDGSLFLYTGNNDRIAEFSKVHRQSPTLGLKPADGAVVLFDGSSADQFENGRMTEDGLLMEGVTSKPRFGSYKLHLEFLLSFMPHGRGQGRANSGCYQQGRYEVQILDSFGLSGEDNECGGIYKIAKPLVNMCFPPLSWQTYDVEFHAARYEGDTKTKNAWMTVKHNGVTIHDHLEIPVGTAGGPLKEGPEDGPIFLQNHGDPIRFRNIWVLPIED
ncbi:MAG: DUF1080 domain-containing protein [Planctomycetaceae bacterium]|nr:DUF1080 domain-containing protein [Planctomycetaceae bacterium]